MRNLKKLRGMKGMSQIELAQKIGVSRALIIYLEKDETTSTSKETTEKLCNILEVTPCELYGYENLKFAPVSKDDLGKFIEVLKEEYEKWDC